MLILSFPHSQVLRPRPAACFGSEYVHSAWVESSHSISIQLHCFELNLNLSLGHSDIHTPLPITNRQIFTLFIKHIALIATTFFLLYTILKAVNDKLVPTCMWRHDNCTTKVYLTSPGRSEIGHNSFISQPILNRLDKWIPCRLPSLVI